MTHFCPLNHTHPHWLKSPLADYAGALEALFVFTQPKYVLSGSVKQPNEPIKQPEANFLKNLTLQRAVLNATATLGRSAMPDAFL